MFELFEREELFLEDRNNGMKEDDAQGEREQLRGVASSWPEPSWCHVDVPWIAARGVGNLAHSVAHYGALEKLIALWTDAF
jgi:hypothetical protein